MRFGSIALSILVVLCVGWSAKAQGVDFDPRAATSSLAKSITEDYQRERARQMRQEQEPSPALDFSRFAAPTVSDKAPAGDGGITCTTIGLSDGYSVTNCQ